MQTARPPCGFDCAILAAEECERHRWNALQGGLSRWTRDVKIGREVALAQRFSPLFQITEVGCGPPPPHTHRHAGPRPGDLVIDLRVARTTRVLFTWFVGQCVVRSSPGISRSARPNYRSRAGAFVLKQVQNCNKPADCFISCLGML